jgi:hypothetical protein
MNQKEEVTLITLNDLSQGMNGEKPKIWHVLSENPEDLSNKMRDDFLPELPNILTLSDQEMALLKKYAEKWAVKAFSKKQSGALFYLGEFKDFIFNNDNVIIDSSGDIVHYVYSKYPIEQLARDGQISRGSYGSIEGLRKAIAEFVEINSTLGQKHEKGLVKSLIAKNLSNIVIYEIYIEKETINLNEAEKILRNHLNKTGISRDDLEKLWKKMQDLKLDGPEGSTSIIQHEHYNDKKKIIQNLKKDVKLVF